MGQYYPKLVDPDWNYSISKAPRSGSGMTHVYPKMDQSTADASHKIIIQSFFLLERNVEIPDLDKLGPSYV